MNAYITGDCFGNLFVRMGDPNNPGHIQGRRATDNQIISEAIRLGAEKVMAYKSECQCFPVEEVGSLRQYLHRKP